LGLVVVDSSRDAYFSEPVRQRTYYEAFELVRSARELVVDDERGAPNQRELERLREELRNTRAWLDSVQGSASWRITAPLRAFKRRWWTP
jgi:hypothetical protein